MKCDEYKNCIFYENAPIASQFRYKQKYLVVSNPHINMTNEEESTMATLGADVSLKTAYNRLKIVQRHIIRMDMMAKSKSPLIDVNRVKWAIITTTAPLIYILRDWSEFMEILGQQKIQKEQRK